MGLIDMAHYVSEESAYFYGGESLEAKDTRLWRLDLATLEFEVISDGQSGPGIRYGASLTMDTREDELYLFGGFGSNGWQNDLWVYDLSSGQWERLAQSCEAGSSCPPRARGSALLSSQLAGTVTMALGTPVESWSGTDQEWRFLRAGRRWVTELEARNIRMGQ